MIYPARMFIQQKTKKFCISSSGNIFLPILIAVLREMYVQKSVNLYNELTVRSLGTSVRDVITT